jgi:hypothetical protein
MTVVNIPVYNIRFKIKEICIFPQHFVLDISHNHHKKQPLFPHTTCEMIDLHNVDTLCSLWGTYYILKYNADYRNWAESNAIPFVHTSTEKIAKFMSYFALNNEPCFRRS